MHTIYKKILDILKQNITDIRVVVTNSVNEELPYLYIGNSEETTKTKTKTNDLNKITFNLHYYDKAENRGFANIKTARVAQSLTSIEEFYDLRISHFIDTSEETALFHAVIEATFNTNSDF